MSTRKVFSKEFKEQNNKRQKLAWKLFGFILLSFIVSVFSFCFLYYTSSSVIQKYALEYNQNTTILLDPNFDSFITLSCILAATIIFICLFMFFVGQKVAYIISISKGVQILKSGDLDFKIDVYENDELSELAEAINLFSCSLKNHIETENILKREKEDLIRNISHDIRTPLTSIISYSDFIKDSIDASDTKLLEYMSIIQLKANQIKDLTDVMLNPNITYTKTQTNGKLMFEQFLSEIEGYLEDEGFAMVIDTENLHDFNSYFNPQDIQRIFDNIYSNILKYANPSCMVSFKLYTDNNTVGIIQSNTIINNFLNNSLNNSNSYGIGLNSIQKLIENYHGKLKTTIDNDTFTIEIKLEIC
ncbi:MAG: histidine kinase dimerization/phospho-acceptor domain-containing protein [Aminipila sp.]